MLVACCCTAHADDCLEVKTAYMMRQIGPVELVPNKPKIGMSDSNNAINIGLFMKKI